MLRISLVRVTNENMDQFPPCAGDVYSRFDINKADWSFVAMVRVDRRISFYKATERAQNRRFHMTRANIDRLANASRGSRVAPEPSARPLELEDMIAQECMRLAVERAKDQTYQFYRILVIFDSIFDIPQTFCCGLVGYNGYHLYQMAEHVREILVDVLKTHGQAGFSVHMEFTMDNVLRAHGNLAVASN
jgi:hypothetical protein